MRETEVKETVEKLAKEISHFTNSFGIDSDAKNLCEELAKDHRTLQQNFTRVCIAWFAKLAEMDEKGYYDLRNEDSVKLGAEFIKHFKDKLYLRHV